MPSPALCCSSIGVSSEQAAVSSGIREFVAENGCTCTPRSTERGGQTGVWSAKIEIYASVYIHKAGHSVLSV